MADAAGVHNVLELRPGDGIDEDAANRQPIVAFNLAGTRLPLVCMRTWRYDVDNYRNLAVALGPDQPIYTASPPVGTTEAEFPRDTEAWARHFSRILGPILDWENLILGGWSYAGVVALHMAEQLVARGRPPLLVNLFDAVMPVAKPRGDARKRTRFQKFVVTLNQGMEIADPVSRREFFVDYVKGQLNGFAGRRIWDLRNLGRQLVGRPAQTHPDLVRKRLKATTPVDPNMMAVRVSYLKARPADTTLPVSLYWTGESQRKLGDASLGWSMRTLGEFHSYPVAGDHQSMFHPENIHSFASALRGELARAAQRAPTPVAAARGAVGTPPTDGAEVPEELIPWDRGQRRAQTLGKLHLKAPVVLPPAPGSDRQAGRGVAEARYADDGSRVVQHPALFRERAGHRGARRGQVGLDSDVELEVQAPATVLRPVLDGALRDVGVREHDAHLVQRVEQRREGAELHDAAGEVAGLDVVAGLEGTEEQQHHSRREVRERALERQADGEARGAEDGDQRRGLDSDHAEHGDDGDRDQQVVGEVPDQAGQRRIQLAAQQQPAHGPPRDARGDETRNQQHHAAEHLEPPGGGELERGLERGVEGVALHGGA
jgi:thioesterase domain-containing protein